MAERIKKGFFKVLPWSVVMLMIISISLGVWYSMPVHLAKAAALAPLTTTYIDADANGTVDNIRLTFTDVTACTYEPGDWTVAETGTIGVTLFVGFTNSATCTTDEYIDVGVITTPQTTGGVTDPQITYTNQGTLASVVADANDGTSTFTATDASKPFIKTITYKDADADGKIDRMTFAYTETVVAASVLAANDLSTTAGDFTGMAFGADATDLITGSVTSTDVNLGTEATAVDTNDATGFLVTTQNAFSLVDGIPNTNATLAGQTQALYIDGAAPFMISATYSDSTADGKVDRVAFAFSEITTFSAITAADWAFSTAGDIGLVGDFALAECAGSGTLATITCTDVGTGTVDATAARTGKQTLAGIEPTITYTNNTNNINDGGGSNNTPTFGPISLVDGAAPVIATTSPVDNVTDVALDANLVITFSETMTEASVTGAIARAPAFTLGAASWNAASTILTYSAHDAFAGMQNYIITLAGTIASAAGTDGNLGAGPVANPFDFTTVGASSGGGGAASLPASITVTTPNGGETLTGGGSYNITWSTVSNSDPVSLYYSTDSGINFLNTIATNETNDGSYTWTVPNVATSTAKVKVVSGSLNDISDSNFTITYSTSAVSVSNSTVVASPTSVTANGTSKSTVTVTVKDSSSNLLSGKTVTLASSRGASDTVTTVTGTTGTNGVATFEVKSSTAGTSTYTATAAGVVLTQTASVSFAAPGTPGETPVSLSVGDLVKSSLSSSVYYYGSDGKRHVFPNEKTYKSWYVDFTGIKTISASQLQGISLGHNVTVRAGTVLVKIQTDPKVYAVEPGGLLRWVPTEARAATLYGSTWATKIIDVPVIFWVDYTFGSDVTTDKHPTGALVQYTGSTEKYYIQGTEKRLISTAGFTGNHFQLSNVLSVSTALSYTLGTPLVAEEMALSRIY
ncbi:Ig-like domain-containing protein [Candidatus Falkowbacteria bacterium]|nr:Ig-like domain-containing protein [Candidatus Falkowbacteria bacterium]